MGWLSALVHLGYVHVEKISFPEGLGAELAEVEVGAGEVNVLHMFLSAARVTEALLADFAAVPVSFDNFFSAKKYRYGGKCL